MVHELVDEINKSIEKKIKDIHTIIPGKIVSFDYETGLAVVKPEMKYKTDDGQSIEYPAISGVPVVSFQFCNQEVSISCPIHENDGCLILIAEQSLDYWMYGQETSTDLSFDLSNAVCLPGLFVSPSQETKESIKNGEMIFKAFGSKMVLSNGKVSIISPNTNIDGELKIQGQLSIKGTLDVDGDIEATGSIKTESTLQAKDAKIEESLDVQGDLTSGGTLNVTGEAIIGGALQTNNDLTVAGKATVKDRMSVSGNIAVSGDMEVSGTAEIKKKATIGGKLQVKDDTSIDGDLSVTGTITDGSNADSIEKSGYATATNELTGKKIYYRYDKWKSGKVHLFGQEISSTNIASIDSTATTMKLTLPKDSSGNAVFTPATGSILYVEANSSNDKVKTEFKRYYSSKLEFSISNESATDSVMFRFNYLYMPNHQ